MRQQTIGLVNKLFKLGERGRLFGVFIFQEKVNWRNALK